MNGGNIKKAYWPVEDLNKILAFIENQGAIIHNTPDLGEGFILTDWKHDRGEIMFAFRTSGRINNKIMYEVRYTPDFERVMENNI